MKKYFRALFYMIWPNYKQVRNHYMQDVVGILDYLRSLKIGEEVKSIFFATNALSTLVTVFKCGEYRAIKIGLHKYWDLKREFDPIDTAWMLVDGSNKLVVLSFDKDLFKQLLSNKQINF